MPPPAFATRCSTARAAAARGATLSHSSRRALVEAIACSTGDDALGDAVCPWKYGVGGLLVGVLFPGLAWLLELGHPSTWSTEAVSAMHRANPLHWIIDTAPIVLALFSTPIGVWRHRQRVAQYEHDVLETVLGTVDGVILLFDANGQIWHVNRATERILGFTAGDICHQTVWDVVVPGDAGLLRERCREDVSQGFPLQFESVCALPGGRRRRLAWSITPVPISTRRIRLFLATGIDVTERHQLHERLTFQASHDPLTGLANRTLFLEQVHRALERAPNDVCVLFIDLDNFKGINDRFGHAIGDRLLQATSRILLNATRGADTVARLGGDEFAVLLDGVGSFDGATPVVRRVLGALSDPVSVGAGTVRIGASIGLTFSTGADSAERLLSQADAAMYAAKREGRGCWRAYDPTVHADAAETEASVA